MSFFHHKKQVSVQTIRRLPQYLRLLHEWQGYGRELASSTDLADETHLPAIVVKKICKPLGLPASGGPGLKLTER